MVGEPIDWQMNDGQLKKQMVDRWLYGRGGEETDGEWMINRQRAGEALKTDLNGAVCSGDVLSFSLSKAGEDWTVSEC